MATKRKSAVLILTHGRPDRVFTVNALQKSGYTGKFYIVIDDLDVTGNRYRELYGDKVVVFDKRAVASKMDNADNFGTMRGVVYARNACFDIAQQLGLTHFLQFDDDYRKFDYRFDERLDYTTKTLWNLDPVLEAFFDFLDDSGADCVAMAQGGDFIGGSHSTNAEIVRLRRELMNAFFCRTDRPVKFLGQVNEDVNLYVDGGSRGGVFLTANHVSLVQTLTQSNAGGMTELYLDHGTYLKSFYSVLFQPSCVRIGKIQGESGRPRIHHQVAWRNAVPKILRESLRKA